VSHPDCMDHVVAGCGNAKTYPHGWMSLAGGKSLGPCCGGRLE
jgi:hypothetical protein